MSAMSPLDPLERARVGDTVVTPVLAEASTSPHNPARAFHDCIAALRVLDEDQFAALDPEALDPIQVRLRRR